MTSTEEQIEAWDRYSTARRRADRTLKIEDGIAAVRAWKEFSNVFLPEGRRLPIDVEQRNIAVFPVHKTRMPSGDL